MSYIIKNKIEIKPIDIYIFIINILTFIIIGFIFIYSSSSIYSLEKFGYSYYFLKKQLIGFFISLISIIFFYLIPTSYIKRFAKYQYILSISILLLTFTKFLGNSINGSSRWINIFGLSFQPSELVKMAFIIYISYLITNKANYIYILFILFMTDIILLKQPDFGQTVTITIVTFILLFIAEYNIIYMIYTLLLSIPISIFLVLMKPYRLKRIMIFLNPWNDKQGSGFQIIQSLIAIGSGHIKGLGIANSKQKFFYLPMQHTDFIYSIICEELGFIGGSLIILLFLMFLYLGLKITLTFKDNFFFYISLGFISLITLQAIINISVSISLLPTKGIGLPFISYGNSALIMNISMIGLILNFIRYEKTNKYE